MAMMHRAGVVDHRGRLIRRHPLVIERDGQRMAQLAEGVSFSQTSARRANWRRAAIRAGVELLLRLAVLQAGDIEKFIIAGAFGAYIDVHAASTTGLFPALSTERFGQVVQRRRSGVQRMLASAGHGGKPANSPHCCRYVSSARRPASRRQSLQHIDSIPHESNTVNRIPKFNITIIGERQPASRARRPCSTTRTWRGSGLAVKQAEAGRPI